jgi:hypothetical protein
VASVQPITLDLTPPRVDLKFYRGDGYNDEWALVIPWEFPRARMEVQATRGDGAPLLFALDSSDAMPGITLEPIPATSTTPASTRLRVRDLTATEEAALRANPSAVYDLEVIFTAAPPETIMWGSVKLEADITRSRTP